MAFYKIHWKRSAQKELKQLPKIAITHIIHAVEQLPETPYPSGVKKLAGTEHTYRLRVGTYRIVYSVLASILTIEIIRVRHRKDVYRK